MNRFAASTERVTSEVPSGPYNGICSRLEGTGRLETEGKEFLESPFSRARPQLTPPEYQERNSFVNRKREFRLTNSSAPPKRCRGAVSTRSDDGCCRPAGEKWICAGDRRQHPRRSLRRT